MQTARRRSRFDIRVIAAFLALAVVAVFLAQLLDHWAFESLYYPEAEHRDWARMFRITGFLPTWLVVAAAMVLSTRGRASAARTMLAALNLVGAAILGGLLAEGVKLLVRRERPGDEWGAYVFRPFSDRPWSTSDLAMPSSHAAVAFAAAFVLWKFYPRAGIVWLAIPIGCAATRLFDRAHYLSDMAGAAACGLAAAWILARLTGATRSESVIGFRAGSSRMGAGGGAG
ncbi:MAG TPA: phosphatase PAP2 family protein [Phycisphaerales bacterium]|nr:phosphatase PAP2 family protein [Phycisphaerales bacterium]